MFEYDGKNFVLKYNVNRVELIEDQTDLPSLVQIQRTSGMFKLRDLKIYFAYGLKEEGADVFYSIKKGLEICEKLIEEKGYPYVASLVLENLQRDCPFFFQDA